MRTVILFAAVALMIAGCGIRQAREAGWQNHARAVCADQQGHPGYGQCLSAVYSQQAGQYNAMLSRVIQNSQPAPQRYYTGFEQPARSCPVVGRCY